MAKRGEEKPREHVIERAPSDRATCRSCERPIGDGELRLAEAYVAHEGRWARSHAYARTPRPSAGYDSGDDRGHRAYDSVNPDLWQRYHHLACAARREPYKLRSALAATTLEIAYRAELEAAIERALSGADLAQEDPATRDEYERFAAALDGPEGDEVALVFADWLQSVGDPRGELINVQHALETAAGEERARLAESERRILSTHKKRLLVDGFTATLEWRRGFVRRLQLTERSLASSALPRVFTHPSFRLLTEMAVEAQYSANGLAAQLPKPLPVTLRTLELRCASAGPVDALLADQAPRLEHLAIHGAASLDALRHPSLRSLELGAADATEGQWATATSGPMTLAARIAALDVRQLPSLRRLTLRVARGLPAAVAALTDNGPLVAQIDELALAGDLGSSGVDRLARAARRFGLVDVSGCKLDRAQLAALQAIADRVVTPEAAAPAPPAAPKPVGEWLVRHTRKPEWGVGRVVEELDEGGLVVEFEAGGRKTVRNVELLEDV
jgi:uncharacterized protein (TIGR02996 family)